MQSKTVLVTGGAKRVGAAICRRLHAAGANIALHYRSSAHDALALQAELNALRPGSVLCVQADLLNLHDLPRMVHETVAHFGKLDALVNIDLEKRTPKAQQRSLTIVRMGMR